MPSKPNPKPPELKPLLQWIGLEIVRRRNEARKVQKEVADAAGKLSDTSISSIELGKQDMRISTLQRLAWAFNVSVPQFLSSRVPARFHKKGRAEWHDLLESVFDSEDPDVIATATHAISVAARLAVDCKPSGKPRR